MAVRPSVTVVFLITVAPSRISAIVQAVTESRGILTAHVKMR